MFATVVTMDLDCEYSVKSSSWYAEELNTGGTENCTSTRSLTTFLVIFHFLSRGYIRDEILPNPSNRLIYPILNDRIGVLRAF